MNRRFKGNLEGPCKFPLKFQTFFIKMKDLLSYVLLLKVFPNDLVFRDLPKLKVIISFESTLCQNTLDHKNKVALPFKSDLSRFFTDLKL